MSHSIMQMADEILGGMLTNPTPKNTPVSKQATEEAPLPDISDEVRASLVSESMQSSAMAEKLGPELKPHASQTTKSFTPGGKEGKHTKVSVSSDDRAKLSPGAKQKLKSHDQRSASRDDARTSWAVDRPQSHQKAKWGSESDRQSTHSASRGKPTRGAKPTSGSTKVMGHSKSNADISTAASRQAKLSPDKQAALDKNKPAHAATRRAKSDQARKDSREKWRRTNPAMKRQRDEKARKMKAIRKSGGTPDRSKGASNMVAVGESRVMHGENKMKNDDILTLIRARDIIREASTAGGIGTTGMGGSANKAYHQNRAQNDNAWTPETPVAPVDKALSKVGDTKITKKKVAKALKDRLKKKNEAPTEAFEKFLQLVLSDVQLEDKNWIDDATDDIEKRGTKGKCTPTSKPGCTGKAKALANTFKKMGEAGDEQEVNDEDHAPASSKSAKKKNKKNMRKVKSK